jgi:hypothetical protein
MQRLFELSIQFERAIRAREARGVAQWQSQRHLSGHFGRHGAEPGCADEAAYDRSAQQTLLVGRFFEYYDDTSECWRYGCFDRAGGRFVVLNLDDEIVSTTPAMRSTSPVCRTTITTRRMMMTMTSQRVITPAAESFADRLDTIARGLTSLHAGLAALLADEVTQPIRARILTRMRELLDYVNIAIDRELDALEGPPGPV